MNTIAPGSPDEIDALADRIAETAATLDATTHRLLTDLRCFDEKRGWGRQGALSCAHWLSWRCGIGLGAAREQLRVAHALGRLPLIDDELRLAKLSFSKARAMTRVATPENETKLVELARHSIAAQLEKICRSRFSCARRRPPASSRPVTFPRKRVPMGCWRWRRRPSAATSRTSRPSRYCCTSTLPRSRGARTTPASQRKHVDACCAMPGSSLSWRASKERR